jgi:D-sedoheptulose 7-phosphate isomerase
MPNRTDRYFSALGSMAQRVIATTGDGSPMVLDSALETVVERARATHDGGGTIMFIGNGGSAAIASHMANDYAKNGRLRAVCYNDGAALTCLANDLGYENVFAYPISLHARTGDLLVAISSSGRSASILNGVAAARKAGCSVVAMSGFAPDNPLRHLGDVNLYVPDGEYGFVEITHLALCHAVLDYAMGWTGLGQTNLSDFESNANVA